MNIQKSEPETIWYLEMLKPEELRPKSLPPETQLVKFGPALPAMNRFFLSRGWQNLAMDRQVVMDRRTMAGLG